MITNHHVVEGFGRVSVVVNDSSSYQGTVRGIDHVRDLAVVSICCGRFQALPFGDASDLEAGDEVVAIGYALGLLGEATITRGIVSATRFDAAHQSEVIQTDAAINPGNSGGPMLSPAGEILGINTFRYDESDSGRPVEGLGFAISEKTVRARIPALKAVRAAPTPTPTRRATPTPATWTSDSFGPINGELRHDPVSGLIETQYAGVSMADGFIGAEFINPYSAQSNSWDYGFILRKKRNGPAIQVIVTSYGYWYVNTGTNAPYKEVSKGTLKAFDTSAGGRNSIAVFAVGERGVLFVNGEFISFLDFSNVTRAGDIAVITGAFTGNVVAGAVTRYIDFIGDSLIKQYGPVGGRIFDDEPDRIGEYRSEVWTQDLVVEAELVNPQGSDWDYGFVIRNPEFDRLEVIGLADDGWWFHYSKDVGDEDYTKLADGYLWESKADFLSRNHLLLLAFGNAGRFFVNGQLVARLDLSHNQDYGAVSLMNGFFNNHAGEPGFDNFNVWTP